MLPVFTNQSLSYENPLEIGKLYLKRISDAPLKKDFYKSDWRFSSELALGTIILITKFQRYTSNPRHIEHWQYSILLDGKLFTFQLNELEIRHWVELKEFYDSNSLSSKK